MIKYGPMASAIVLAAPIVYFVVARKFIPFIMRLQITSANEILEMRFGIGVRMLGTLLFLMLRLTWMAVIIYATTDKVLVPLLGIDRAYLPLVCAALGLLTVVYTSMGGLRAVVLTDVIQSVILLAGSVLAVGLISWRLGGVGTWWPDAWMAHWSEPVIIYQPGARVTLISATLMAACWWVCTTGSDQVAIQRYLATRDVHAARRVIGASLAVNVVVTLLLAAVGLALLGYYTKFSHLAPGGAAAITEGETADYLFTHFIAHALPPGIGGLVVAALLAAAMSSLSSGVNSAGSVVTVDLIDRLSRSEQSEASRMQRAKLVSWAVGIIVVLLTTVVGQVPGNLFEIAQKVTNLLVVPLFMLFFMAMFVRWASPLGAIAASASSLATSIAVAYYNVLGIDFSWMMPSALVVGIPTGMLVSLIPLGPRGRCLPEASSVRQ
jgi:SSS family transporter